MPFVFFSFHFFFSVRHSSNDYHWKIHITVLGIFMVSLLSVDYFLDSIGMLDLIPYSFISNYFYFHVCLCYTYFCSEKLGLKKWWTFIITLKYSFFWRPKVLIPCFKMYYKNELYFLKAFEDFCLKLWRTLSELFRYLTFFRRIFKMILKLFSLGKVFRIYHLKYCAISTPPFFSSYLLILSWALASTLGQNQLMHILPFPASLSPSLTPLRESTVVWDIKP